MSYYYFQEILFKKKEDEYYILLTYFRSGAAADTAKSFYLNVEPEYDGARGGVISAICLFAIPYASTYVVPDEAGTGACSADQILATDTEELDHVDEPDQGESASEQWSESTSVQKLRINTAVAAEHHSVSGEKGGR